jgi:hypothetical protein
MKPATPNRVYLQQVHLPERWFLEEVLNWLTFQRLPVSFADSNGYEVHSVVMPGYRTDLADHRLTDDECKRVGLPRDPRNSFQWASCITLLDDLETLAALAKEQKKYVWRYFPNMTARDFAINRKKMAQFDTMEKAQGLLLGSVVTVTSLVSAKEIAKLQKKLEMWTPKYKQVIEFPAAKLYVALKEGKLAAAGIRLPDVDHEAALGALAKKSRNLSKFRDVEIPREFWSEQQIFWELSAARNDREHYCQIHCNSAELLSVFPCESFISGIPVTGKRFGAIYVVESPPAGGRATNRPGKQLSRRPGRPPQYQWEDVHVELARLSGNGGLPSKKEACIAHVREFFINRGLSPPSRAAISEKLTRYYDQLMRDVRSNTESQ